MDRFDLRKDAQPQKYGIGLKEIWQIDPAKHKQGLVVHTAGWPLDTGTYGGSWMYHLEDNTVSIGIVVGLSHKTPYLNTFRAFQRYQTHPAIHNLLDGGKRTASCLTRIPPRGVPPPPQYPLHRAI